MSLIVRFNEATRYDITQDREVICFMAMTNAGTYHAEVPLLTTRGLRDKRNAFKDKVIEKMEAGQPPCEVDIG